MANLRWCVARRNLVLIKQFAHTRERPRRMRLHRPVGKPQRLSGLGNIQVQHEPARKNLALDAGKPTDRSDNRVTLDHSLKLIDGWDLPARRAAAHVRAAAVVPADGRERD